MTWPSTQAEGARSMYPLSFCESICKGQGLSGLVPAAVAGRVLAAAVSSDMPVTAGGVCRVQVRVLVHVVRGPLMETGTASTLSIALPAGPDVLPAAFRFAEMPP